jgi:hypothetical protein
MDLLIIILWVTAEKLLPHKDVRDSVKMVSRKTLHVITVYSVVVWVFWLL